MNRPTLFCSYSLGVLAVGLALLAGASSAGEVQEPPVPSPSRASAEALEADGWAQLCRFRGRFVGGGLPTEPTRAIPVDSYDLRFLLVVRVEELLVGAVPEPWEDEIVFAVHSPSMFFRLRHGLTIAKGRHVPDGELLFSLWRKGSAYRLEIERIPPGAG